MGNFCCVGANSNRSCTEQLWSELVIGKVLKGSKKGLKGVVDPIAFNLALEEVWLQDNMLTDLIDHDCSESASEHLSKWSNAELIYLADNQLTQLPEEVDTWINLCEFSISNNPEFGGFPETMASWTRLRQFYACGLPRLSCLPPAAVKSWKDLTVLHLNDCGNLTELPDTVDALGNLTQVSLINTALSHLPPGVGHWVNVEKLFLNGNKRLTCLPVDMGGMVKLSKLYAMDCDLHALPPTLSLCGELEELYVSGNPHLTAIPVELGTGPSRLSLNKLYAARCGLIGQSLRPNNTTAQPDSMPPNQQELGLGDTALIDSSEMGGGDDKTDKQALLSSAVVAGGGPPSSGDGSFIIVNVNIDDTENGGIEYNNETTRDNGLPSSLVECRRLEILNVSDNPKLRCLPTNLAQCVELKFIQAANCGITELPVVSPSDLLGLRVFDVVDGNPLSKEQLAAAAKIQGRLVKPWVF